MRRGTYAVAPVVAHIGPTNSQQQDHMNIIHLSTFEPFDIYLHQQLKRTWPEIKAVRVVWPTGKDSRKKRLQIGRAHV